MSLIKIDWDKENKLSNKALIIIGLCLFITGLSLGSLMGVLL